MSTTSTEFLSNFKEAIMATHRPWPLLLDLSALSFPSSLSEATTRVTHNLAYFLFNYALIVLFVFFVSLVYHPFSIIVFLLLLAAWYFLYFSRDEPLNLFNLVVLDDRAVLVGLGVATVLALFLTQTWLNVVLSLLIGLAVVCLHAAFRGTEDLVADDQESPYGPMLNESGGAGAYSLV